MSGKLFSESGSQRIFGLDLLRCIAILMVVYSHSSFLFPEFVNQVLGSIYLDGVELFFVLSGFLIGNIIIKNFDNPAGLTFGKVKYFLVRRWLRTLPNYYLFLMLNILLIYLGVISGTINKYSFAYFVFLQNFHVPVDFMFWESWSLAVEEWFYLLFPSFIFLIGFIAKKVSVKNLILIAIIVFLTLPFIYRIWSSNPGLDWDLFFRKLVLTRLDTIAFGLLASFIYSYYPNIWKKMKYIALAIGLVLVYFVKNVQVDAFWFKQTVYFTLSSLGIALLLPILSSLNRNIKRFSLIQFISKISYSIYLVHLPLLAIVLKYFKFGNGLQALLFWTLTIGISFLVYRLFELPILKLRNHL